MIESFEPDFAGWELHTVTGLVGVVADQGLAVDRNTRTVFVTLLQNPSNQGGDEVFHHLIFEDDEADRVLALNVQSGDTLLVSLGRLAPKAYLVGEGDALKLVPYVESQAEAALILQRAGCPEPVEDFSDQYPPPYPAEKVRAMERKARSIERARAKRARADRHDQGQEQEQDLDQEY
jgi:hypothetical protein